MEHKDVMQALNGLTGEQVDKAAMTAAVTKVDLMLTNGNRGGYDALEWWEVALREHYLKAALSRACHKIKALRRENADGA